MLKENRFKFDSVGDPLLDKVIGAFVIFPFNYSYVDKLLEDINYQLEDRYDTQVVYYTEDEIGISYIQVSSETLGTFAKYFDIIEDFKNPSLKVSKFECTARLMENPEQSYSEEIVFCYGGCKSKREVDFVCQCVAPYYATNGEHIESVPLLVNVFPEFSRYVLVEGQKIESKN